MTCRCKERREVLEQAVKKPSTVFTAVRFCAKTGAQDAASVTKAGTYRILAYLSKRA